LAEIPVKYLPSKFPDFSFIFRSMTNAVISFCAGFTAFSTKYLDTYYMTPAPFQMKLSMRITAKTVTRQKLSILWKKLQPYVYAGLGYLALAIITTWPLIRVMGTKAIGYPDEQNPDLDGTLWFHWWVRHAIYTHQNPFYCDMIYYPIGRNLIFLFKNILDCFLAIPFYNLFGYPAYYNVICILLMVFNGLAMYCLARHFTKNHLIAFFTGFIVVYDHTLLAELQEGRILQYIIGLPILYILFLLKVIEEDLRINIIMMALMLLLSSLFYWFYGIFLVTMTVPFVLTYGIFQKGRLKKPQIMRILLSFGLFTILVLPFTAPALRYLSAAKSLPQTPFLQDYPSLQDLQAIMIEGVSDPRISALGQSVCIDRELFKFPIVVLLLGVFLPFLRARQSGYHWIFTWIFMFLLAAGPYLKLGHAPIIPYDIKMAKLAATPHLQMLYAPGIPYDIKMPYYYFYKYVPTYSRLFWPGRLMEMVAIMLGVLFCINLDWLVEKIDKKKPGISSKLILILFLITIVEMTWVKPQLPFKLRNVTIPRIFNVLRAEKDCAIIEIPYLYCPQSIVNQIMHQKKSLGGPGTEARWDHPKEFVDFWKSNSFLVYLENLNNQFAPFTSFNPKDLQALRKLGFKYIVFNQNQCSQAVALLHHHESPELEAALSERIQDNMEELFGQPVYQGEGVIIYKMIPDLKSDLPQD